MKIGILTFVHAYNYGAELQCFALQQKLSLLGYDVSVLDVYRPGDPEYIYPKNNKRFEPLFSYGGTTKSDAKSKIKIKIAHFVNYFARFIFYRRYKNRKRAFVVFHEQYTRLTNDKFLSYQELYNKSSWPFSHMIVGSDQVWNYTLHFSNEPYFLTFAKGVKKISYAASIGHSNMPSIVADHYKSWLTDFNSLSLREEQGVQLIKEITGRKDVVNVLDPVFLLTKNEWLSSLELPNNNGDNYVIVYLLSRSVFSIKIAKLISKKLNCKVLLITTEMYNQYPGYDIEVLFSKSPKDFVNLFANSKFVVTNSFHGTSFAINFNIPFISTTRKSKRYNSRFESLLGKTRLIDRLLYENSVIPDVSPYININFDKANDEIQKMRDFSLDFLSKSLL